MRKFLLLASVFTVSVASTALADTIHLKNGSVLKGKVASFADDQFIVMLDTGSGRYLSRALVYMGDVARIDFDSASAVDSTATKPAESSPKTITELRTNLSAEEPKETRRAETQPRETPPDIQPTATAAKEASREPVKETAKEPVREESTLPEKPAVTTTPPSTTTAASETTDLERPTTRKLAAIKSMNVDVVAKKDWTSSGMIVKRGDHIRVIATGSITLDPVNGRTCGPEGIADLPDPKKLMPDQPTGALIAVISSDNDDFIFLGRSGEFTATRDGLLFLSVNEGHLPDNVGVFKAVVELLGQRK